MNQLVEQLREDLKNEEARYACADTVTNAFVSTQIKGLREERGLSQEELANLIGTTQSGISRLEKAYYSAWKVETLRKLARAFGVRLRVRFEGFGTLVDEITGFDDRNLLPKTFETDPAFNPILVGRKKRRRILSHNIPRQGGTKRKHAANGLGSDPLPAAAPQIRGFVQDPFPAAGNNSSVSHPWVNGNGNQCTGALYGN